MIHAPVEAAKNIKNVVVKMSELKEKLAEIFKKYDVSICYVFGSQKDNALRLIEGEKVEIEDT